MVRQASKEGTHTLQDAKWLLDETEEGVNSSVSIHKERFHKLVTASRTVVADEYKLDKRHIMIYWMHSDCRHSSTRA